jgi:hypothetical protein
MNTIDARLGSAIAQSGGFGIADFVLVLALVLILVLLVLGWGYWVWRFLLGGRSTFPFYWLFAGLAGYVVW